MTADPGAGPVDHAIVAEHIARRLSREFGAHFTEDSVRHFVDDTYRTMERHTGVRTFLPVFVERFARDRLRAVAKLRGDLDHPPVVLFVCERDDAASQMAAALFTDVAGDEAVAWSAGAVPAGDLLEEAVEVLHEEGVDVLGAFPKPLTPEIEAAADVIVTLDAHDDVEIVGGVHEYRAWALPRPEERGLDGYRELREELHRRVVALYHDLVDP